MRQLLSRDEIRAGVQSLAEDLRQHYGGQQVTIVGILTGSLVVLADVIRLLDMPLRVALIQASSYRGRSTLRSPLRINDQLLSDLAGQHVLVLDDIFDTGHTMAEVLGQIAKHKPASVRSAVLLRKADRCEVDIQPDHVVFEIPNEFVVGYGLDFDDMYRNLPYVAALEQHDLAAADLETDELP